MFLPYLRLALQHLVDWLSVLKPWMFQDPSVEGLGTFYCDLWFFQWRRVSAILHLQTVLTNFTSIHRYSLIAPEGTTWLQLTSAFSMCPKAVGAILRFSKRASQPAGLTSMLKGFNVALSLQQIVCPVYSWVPTLDTQRFWLCWNAFNCKILICSCEHI